MGRPTDIVWKLLKMLPGQRAAGAGWIRTARQRLEGEGFENSAGLPQFYYRRADKILIEVHMDDFHGEGPARALAGVILRLREIFDLKATDVILTCRCSHLKRERLKLPNGNLVLRANPKYIDDIVELMSMGKSKTVTTPSLLEDPPEDSPMLNEEDTTRFRSAVGTALYVPPDREDIQRDVLLMEAEGASRVSTRWTCTRTPTLQVARRRGGR